MQKSISSFLLICVALATAAPPPNLANTSFKQPTIEQLKACGSVEMIIEKHCTRSLPPVLKNSQDLQVLTEHPELCCHAHHAFLCIEQGMKKAEVCRPVWPLLKTGFDEQMKAFPDNGCDIEKCK